MTNARKRESTGRAPDLSIVVPVYRAQDCLGPLVQAIEQALAGRSYEVVLVNDCSPDASWQVIEDLCRARPEVVGVELRRNFGQDNAILTGLRQARGRVLAIMDDDLQHHPRDLPRLLDGLARGADVVYAAFPVKYQKWWKNLGSWFNGKAAEWLLGKPRGLYLSPYKVLRREVAELICAHDGPDPYVDALLLRVTAHIGQVPVEHHRRHAGASTYTFRQSVRVWARMAFSSVRPLRLALGVGAASTLLGLLLAGAALAARLLAPGAVPAAAVGWAVPLAAQLVVGGAQMVFVGLLGECAGRTWRTVGKVPQSVVRRVLNAGGPVEEVAPSSRAA